MLLDWLLGKHRLLFYYSMFSRCNVFLYYSLISLYQGNFLPCLLCQGGFIFRRWRFLVFTAIYYHFLSAAVALAILERNLSFEPSPETITPRYLKLVNRPFLSYLTQYDIQIYNMVFVLEANYYWHMTHARRFAQDFIMDEIDFNLIQYKTKKILKK